MVGGVGTGLMGGKGNCSFSWVKVYMRMHWLGGGCRCCVLLGFNGKSDFFSLPSSVWGFGLIVFMRSVGWLQWIEELNICET